MTRWWAPRRRGTTIPPPVASFSPCPLEVHGSGDLRNMVVEAEASRSAVRLPDGRTTGRHNSSSTNGSPPRRAHGDGALLRPGGGTPTFGHMCREVGRGALDCKGPRPKDGKMEFSPGADCPEKGKSRGLRAGSRVRRPPLKGTSHRLRPGKPPSGGAPPPRARFGLGPSPGRFPSPASNGAGGQPCRGWFPSQWAPSRGLRGLQPPGGTYLWGPGWEGPG